MLILHIFTLPILFFLLAVVTDEFFIESLYEVGKRLQLSNEAAGATLMAAGSSAPELFISFIALFRLNGLADIGAGTIVGSAIFNILVIIGVASMFRQARLIWQVAMRDMLFYVLSIVLLLHTFWDGIITFQEASYFVMLYVFYIFAVVKWKSWLNYSEVNPVDVVEKDIEKGQLTARVVQIFSKVYPSRKRYIIVFLESILFIGVLSYLMIESAISAAEVFNISPAIIGLTVLAIGTSVPDLLSSIVVARRGMGNMAVSNAVGSNIFDILFGLGSPWVVVILFTGHSVTVSTENLLSSVFLLFATVIALLFILIVKQWHLGKRAGTVLIILYILYLGSNIISVL